ncbi:MAG: DUF883 family protein [Pseudobdellovibrionaceae bacterium]
MDATSNLNGMRERQGNRQESDKGVWTEGYEAVQHKARQVTDASEEFIRAHPFYTLLGAATVGFIAGMLIRRRD